MADRTISQALRQLRQSVERYPARVREKLAPLAGAAASDLAARVRAAYPEGPTASGSRRRKSGSTIPRARSLKYGVRTGKTRDGLGAWVATSAPHTHLYEYGTNARRTSTGAARGRMPRKVTFIPLAVAARRRMVAAAERIVAAEPLEGAE